MNGKRIGNSPLLPHGTRPDTGQYHPSSPMNVAVGVRVVRGPDWSWEDQDGGEGNVGTVVEVKELTSDGKDSVLCGTTVIVCWDIGVLSNYRCGFGGKFDVRVYDNAQTGKTPGADRGILKMEGSNHEHACTWTHSSIMLAYHITQ